MGCTVPWHMKCNYKNFSQDCLPFQQSTVPRRRHHCTACRVQGRRVNAVCGFQSVPAARCNDARRCPGDCELLATRDPTHVPQHQPYHQLSSLHVCDWLVTLPTIIKSYDTIHVLCWKNSGQADCFNLNGTEMRETKQILVCKKSKGTDRSHSVR